MPIAAHRGVVWTDMLYPTSGNVHVACYMSNVTCHLAKIKCGNLHIICHLSYIMCLMPPVTFACHMSYVICRMSHYLVLIFWAQAILERIVYKEITLMAQLA